MVGGGGGRGTGEGSIIGMVVQRADVTTRKALEAVKQHLAGCRGGSFADGAEEKGLEKEEEVP
jgi:hypothetical protein